MQDMLQNKTQVQTANFRLYFKVIVRQIEYNSLDRKSAGHGSRGKAYLSKAIGYIYKNVLYYKRKTQQVEEH